MPCHSKAYTGRYQVAHKQKLLHRWIDSTLIAAHSGL